MEEFFRLLMIISSDFLRNPISFLKLSFAACFILLTASSTAAGILPMIGLKTLKALWSSSIALLSSDDSEGSIMLG